MCANSYFNAKSVGKFSTVITWYSFFGGGGDTHIVNSTASSHSYVRVPFLAIFVSIATQFRDSTTDGQTESRTFSGHTRKHKPHACVS